MVVLLTFFLMDHLFVMTMVMLWMFLMGGMGPLGPIGGFLVLFDGSHPDRVATFHRVVGLGTRKDMFLVGQKRFHTGLYPRVGGGAQLIGVEPDNIPLFPGGENIGGDDGFSGDDVSTHPAGFFAPIAELDNQRAIGQAGQNPNREVQVQLGLAPGLLDLRRMTATIARPCSPPVVPKSLAGAMYFGSVLKPLRRGIFSSSAVL